jgi:integrase
MGKLTTIQIDAIKTSCRLCDGDGLWLYVKPSLKKSWVLRYRKDMQRREAGLGSYPVVTIKKARTKAIDFKRAIDDGKDPIAEKKRKRDIPSFEKAALECYNELAPTFRNHKHSQMWINSLRDYAFPRFGNVRVDQVTHDMVFDAISKIWLIKNDTARRVRQRIMKVIGWAVAKGYRAQPIPLEAINGGLPKYEPKVQHHAALPYEAIQGVMANIRNEVSIPRLALELAILTGSRTGEVRKAAWSQFDFENNVWIRPDEIMKNDMVHIVPLSAAALNVLDKVKALTTATGSKTKDDVVFQGTAKIKMNNKHKRKQYVIEGVLNENAILNTLKPLANGIKVTTHGFRSTFRDWTREKTQFKDDVAEKCLSHTNDNKVEAAYLRTELMQERADLLNAWADYCGGGGQNVLKLVKG